MLGALIVFAALQLGGTPQVIVPGELKAKVLAGAEGVPLTTPAGQRFARRWSDGRQDEVTLYSVDELWRQAETIGQWRDRKGNMMRLARVDALKPADPRWNQDLAPKEDVEKALASGRSGFRPDEANRRLWQRSWKTDNPFWGAFVTLRDRVYYLEFDTTERTGEKELADLARSFQRSMTSFTSGAAPSGMKWWSMEEKGARSKEQGAGEEGYIFITNLDRARGGKFITDAMRLMGAMRKAYERYVPAEKTLPQCKVRVFRTLAGYRNYRADTGDLDNMSCGLWDPAREELLIVAEDRHQSLETMRHEAFHQYLHYATGRGDHAMWFNEGTAAFFENVRYSPARNSVTITDEGSRAKWVDGNPPAIAEHLPRILRMGYDAFYSGNVNLNYVTAWALAYFLQKGSLTNDRYAKYRDVVRTYLAAMKDGRSAAEATEAAWSGRTATLPQDFLRFWKEGRPAARKLK